MLREETASIPGQLIPDNAKTRKRKAYAAALQDDMCKTAALDLGSLTVSGGGEKVGS